VEAAPKIRRQTTLPRPFPRDEIVRLWALALPPEERLLRALLYYSGLRITPICGIRLSDLSLDPPTIRTIGKGSRPFVVQMHPDLTELLIEHLQARTTPNGDAPLLMRPNGRPFTKRYAERVCRHWGAVAAVADCRPHRFRHTFATELLRVGVDVRVIQEALAHADLKSTMLYTKVHDEQVCGAISRLPDPRGL